MKFFLLLALIAPFLLGTFANAREIPPKNLEAPVDISPQLRNAIEAGIAPWWNVQPKTAEEWKKFVTERASATKATIPALLDSLKVTCKKEEMGGVPVFMLEPVKVPHANKNRILLHLHGGGYVLNPGEAGIGEGAYLAARGGFRVVSVDYRMPPDYPYPAAMDDAMQVYRALLKSYPARNIGVFGTSTGGGMTLALALRARAEGLPMPGALAAGTPWSDLTKTGDSYFSNEYVDNVLVGYDGWLKSAAELYAGGHDMRDPYLSPVYGDLKGFPPTILGTGTRDLFLSNTVRMHRKLREAEVVSDLLVIEGISHAQYMLLPPNALEAQYYFGQVAKFFDRYLGKYM